MRGATDVTTTFLKYIINMCMKPYKIPK